MVHDLYQEIILDHSKRPRNCHSMADATRQAEIDGIASEWAQFQRSPLS